MFRTLIAGTALFLLAGCATAPVMPSGQTVPIAKLLSDTKGRPYECLNYSATSDTCDGIARRRVSGDRIHFDAAALVPGPDRKSVRVDVSVSFRIEGNRYCGNMSNAEIRTEGNLTPAQRSLLEEIVLAELVSAGDLCGIYVRDRSGDYTSVTTDRSGRIQQDGVERVWFFSAPKRLRLAL